MGRYPIPMLETFPVALLTASLLGFLAGIGVGGGSLLILWLTLVLGMDPAQARIMNLLFFLPSAAVASAFRWKQGTLKIRSVLPAIILGCAGAGIGSVITGMLDLEILKQLFGGLLILTGIRELFYRPKK